MSSIDQALAELVLYDQPNIAVVAKSHGVNRSTLSRRWRKVTQSSAIQHQNQQLLSPLQEQTLIKHLNTLTERGLSPTPAIVRNLAAEIAKKEPGSNWTSRFIQRHQYELQSQYLVPIDSERYKADLDKEFSYWFDSLQEKIAQYSILPEN